MTRLVVEFAFVQSYAFRSQPSAKFWKQAENISVVFFWNDHYAIIHKQRSTYATLIIQPPYFVIDIKSHSFLTWKPAYGCAYTLWFRKYTLLRFDMFPPETPWCAQFAVSSWIAVDDNHSKPPEIIRKAVTIPFVQLFPVIFDMTVLPKRVKKAAGEDLIVTSACNFYDGVTQQEASDFYAVQTMADADSDSPISVGLNSTLVKRNGQMVEEVWKAIVDDESAGRPDHGDQDDVLVGFSHEKGGRQEKDDGCKGQEHPQGRPLLQESLDFVLCRFIHCKHPFFS